MRSTLSLWIGTLALLVGFASCAKPESPVDLEVADIVLGRSLAADGTIPVDDRTNLYWTTDPFRVSVQLEGVGDDVRLQARWTGPDGAVAAESTRAVSARGTTVVGLEVSPPENGRWPEGDYTVEIFINGTSQGTRELNAR